MTENNERRKHTRIGNDMPLSFSLSMTEFTNLKQVEAYGTMLDRSEEGLGFFTDVRLEPGQCHQNQAMRMIHLLQQR